MTWKPFFRPSKFTPLFLAAALFLVGGLAAAGYVGQYGAELCERDRAFRCVVVRTTTITSEIETKSGTRQIKSFGPPTWESLFPEERERETIKKINRMNVRLQSGYRVAVPVEMKGKDLMDFSPFPDRVKPFWEKVVIFDPRLYAFAAYDEQGRLVKWGPAVGGRPGLETPAGEYRIVGKRGAGCRSRKYPAGCTGSGCSPMPYCMYFGDGFAFHGGPLPGRHASHGCVRLFKDDAMWLNLEFVEEGTRVIIRPY